MTNKANQPWWEITDITRAATTRGSIDQIATLSFIAKALKENLCVYDHAKDGNLLITPDEFLKEISDLGGRIISKSLSEAKDTLYDTSDHIFAWEDAILVLSFDDNDWVYLKAVGLDKELIFKVRDITKRTMTQKTKGKAYVFVASESGPELRQISGKAGIELERDNYSEEVLADFDHVVKDLQSNDPCANLVIIDGEPGTGKTYLVRGMTNAVDGATFVLVPPAMISEMMSPQFLPVLMDHHKDGGPIVFIVEDADSCLVKREGDNMNSISSLLNLGAGLFGDLFDVRVVATTNAKKIDMDPAITRHGRTCRYIEVGPLEKDQADDLFAKLTKSDDKQLDIAYPCTLADIYHAARNEKEAPAVVKAKKARKVGF